METSRDDYRAKVELQDRELQDLRVRTDELQRKAEEAQHLKDEVDILRETADRVGQYEATIASYKKKLDEASDMRRQLKLLEDKNLELVQQTLQLEDDVKKSGTWRPQLEQYKKQVAELHSQLAEVSFSVLIFLVYSLSSHRSCVIIVFLYGLRKQSVLIELCSKVERQLRNLVLPKEKKSA